LENDKANPKPEARSAHISKTLFQWFPGCANCLRALRRDDDYDALATAS
jgi:hypothetical protein